jgi:hypothetical protein
MADNLIQFDDPLPDHVVAETRALYAPPGGDSYWTTLEARIMARVANAASIGWWQVLGHWARGGLVAAVAILAIVGVLWTQSTPEELRIAYEAVVRPAPADSFLVPAEVLSGHYGPSTRGATFLDALSY